MHYHYHVQVGRFGIKHFMKLAIRFVLVVHFVLFFSGHSSCFYEHIGITCLADQTLFSQASSSRLSSSLFCTLLIS